jgi:hypothetical protein
MVNEIPFYRLHVPVLQPLKSRSTRKEKPARVPAAVGDRFIGGVVFYDGSDALPFGDMRRALPISALWSPSPISK